MTLFFQVYTYVCMFYMEALSYFLLTLIVFKSMFEPLLKNYFTPDLFIKYIVELLPK